MATYTNSITLVAVEDGTDGKAPIYDIELSNEKIYKTVRPYYNNENVLVTDIINIDKVYPSSITFKLFKTEEGQRNVLLLSEYDYTLTILGEQGETAGDIIEYIRNNIQQGELFSNFFTFTPEEDGLIFNVEYATLNSISVPSLKEIFQTQDIYFVFTAYEKNNKISSKVLTKAVLPFEFTTDLNVKITNTAFSAAIESSAMEFTIDGLTVYDSAFKIVKRDDQHGNVTLLSYDDGNLNIIGNGTFTGVINAEDGYFKGAIEALSGKIGGFIINETGIFSSEDQNFSPVAANLQLYGETGEIFANSITLGSNAKIQDYLQLGNAYLRNPINNNGNFLTIEAIQNESAYNVVTFSDNGILTFSKDGQSSIVIDGPSSSIRSGGNGISSVGFSITPEKAIFNNIEARGKISTTVFEINKVQTVGGSIIFKPSYKIESVVADSNDTIILNEQFQGGENSYIVLIQDTGEIINQTVSYKVIYISDDKKTIRISPTISASILQEAFSLVDLGVDGSLIMGVNSYDGSAILPGRSFSISQMDIINDAEVFSPKVVLGDLSDYNLGLEGYGLYSDNAYLRGSLTTQVLSGQEIKYAGISTNNEITATFEEDNSRIVFWGGADGTSQEAIRGAKFKVTQNGTIYAAQGIFEGAVLTNGIIQGSDIYASRIHGIGSDPALAIYNNENSNGITFFNGAYEANNFTEIFSINSNSLTYKKNAFITLSTEGTVDIVEGNFTVMSFANGYTDNLHFTGPTIKNRTDNNLLLSLTNSEAKLGQTTNHYLSIKDKNIELSHTEVFLKESVNFGDALHYKQHKVNGEIVGYDLYIT